MNTTHGAPMIIIGVAILIARAFAPLIPVTYGGTQYSLGQVHGLCNSTIGQIGQAISATAAHNCGQVNSIYGLMNMAVIAAILLIVAGFTVRVLGDRIPRSQYHA